jgi:hypothetical protein
MPLTKIGMPLIRHDMALRNGLDDVADLEDGVLHSHEQGNGRRETENRHSGVGDKPLMNENHLCAGKTNPGLPRRLRRYP